MTTLCSVESAPFKIFRRRFGDESSGVASVHQMAGAETRPVAAQGLLSRVSLAGSTEDSLACVPLG